jgi:hypothetical protein
MARGKINGVIGENHFAVRGMVADGARGLHANEFSAGAQLRAVVRLRTVPGTTGTPRRAEAIAAKTSARTSRLPSSASGPNQTLTAPFGMKGAVDPEQFLIAADRWAGHAALEE